jgi:hypothetical protein
LPTPTPSSPHARTAAALASRRPSSIEDYLRASRTRQRHRWHPPPDLQRGRDPRGSGRNAAAGRVPGTVPYLADDLNLQFELHQALPSDLPPTAASADGTNRPGLPRPGDRFHDFEVVRLLGAGSFAQVYLARQLSLGRLVALKVSSRGGSEARTLASLEHNHIVQVFSETVEPESNRRLLCMQYVPGTTLASVIAYLAERLDWPRRPRRH